MTPHHRGVSLLTHDAWLAQPEPERSSRLACSCCCTEGHEAVVHVQLLASLAPKEFFRICLKCARAIATVTPLGKEVRRAPNRMRFTVKRYVNSDPDGVPCHFGQAPFEGEAVAFWRTSDMLTVVCARCLNDIALAASIIGPRAKVTP